jgi:hypothetical protein
MYVGCGGCARRHRLFTPWPNNIPYAFRLMPVFLTALFTLVPGTPLEEWPITSYQESDWPGGAAQKFRALRLLVDQLLDGCARMGVNIGRNARLHAP